MHIFDGSGFELNELLVANRIGRKHIVYMDSFYPGPNADYTKAPVERARQIAHELNQADITDCVLDIEYLPNAPSSKCWDLQDPVSRPDGIRLWIETLTAFNDIYEGTVGMYLWADWGDYCMAVIRDGSTQTDYVKGKFDKVSQWESDMRPIVPLVHNIYPCFYFGDVAAYASLDAVEYPYGLTYAQYVRGMALTIRTTVSAIYAFHKVSPVFIEGFVTNNAEGRPYPIDAFSLILRFCKEAGISAVAWNAPAFQPEWPDFECGLMVGYKG